jgi:hypothetical protein
MRLFNCNVQNNSLSLTHLEEVTEFLNLRDVVHIDTFAP